ncbi:MAG TPA: ABC transporter ATP-binding protein, partial [Verrucomicrobiales bacterium]|nr:ABC transporter ATP-binding protein [Verrucomicrobiales bacterium]
MPDTLIAEDLVKRFGDFTAVDRVGLSVAPGEVVGLLGPNGAGKTTTLRMLAGILSPTSGSVRVAGRDLQSDPLATKRQIGFLSGDTQLYRRLSPR